MVSGYGVPILRVNTVHVLQNNRKYNKQLSRPQQEDQNVRHYTPNTANYETGANMESSECPQSRTKNE